ncbi:MarR family winged helix-turn-helix transcriptional regulator [Secundilactobacillus hailunensis]|uniref:MarR family winged helix-turn-helix transcriptional regulator n=1 Tax=Secundilactobacillus hailunensis TaxID=2559923 RepID=A0ABW1T8L6_9LACO|nr:winged helix DNA-binding protein [Secundilactobacillus hailunensis]
MQDTKNYPATTALWRMTSAYRTLVTSQLRQVGIYPGQENVLLELQKCGELSQNDLVKKIVVNHSTIAKSVSRLVLSGFASTTKSSKDRRITLVSLTDSGQIVASQVKQILDQAESAALRGLTTAQQQDFITIAAQIAANLSAEAKR